MIIQAGSALKDSPKATAAVFSPAGGGLLQRKCACGGNPGASGECEACRRKRLVGMGSGIQTKLSVNKPGDRWEQEAERISEAVISESSLDLAVSPPVRHLAMRHIGLPGQDTRVPSLVNETIRSNGAPLDLHTRSFMEKRFGHDFNQVRIHNDSAAAKSAREVSALAYTVGHNIVFGAGQYTPGSTAGKKLLAHELTHVIQQSQPNSPVAPAAYSLRLILPGGERLIGPPKPITLKNGAIGSFVEATPRPEDGTPPQLQRMVAVKNYYEGTSPIIQRTASFTNPAPVAEDPLARLAAGDSPGLTTPTINGQVMGTQQDILAQIMPTQVSQTGSSGGQISCQVDPGFTINTSANMIVASNAGPTGWTGNISPAALGNPPACAGRPQIPATMTALPNNADFVARVRRSEQEHADALQELHNRHFVPYDRFVTGLTGTGPDLNAAGQDLINQLGNQPLQATLGFVLGNQAQVNRLDGPGGTHHDTAMPTFAPGCASVAITVSQTTPNIPGSGPGNVVPVVPVTTAFSRASLTVAGSSLMDGVRVLKSFSTAADAQRALQVIDHYRMTSRNTIGPMEFFLSSGLPPGGPLAGANELQIDPAFYQVSFGIPGANDWAITQVVGNNINVLVNFGANRDQAYSALNILQRFVFTRLCWIGGTRQAPEMMYFRTEQSAFSEPGDYPLRTLPEGQAYA